MSEICKIFTECAPLCYTANKRRITARRKVACTWLIGWFPSITVKPKVFCMCWYSLYMFISNSRKFSRASLVREGDGDGSAGEVESFSCLCCCLAFLSSLASLPFFLLGGSFCEESA